MFQLSLRASQILIIFYSYQLVIYIYLFHFIDPNYSFMDVKLLLNMLITVFKLSFTFLQVFIFIIAIIFFQL